MSHNNNPNHPPGTDLFTELKTRDLDRLREYAENLSFYQGDQWEKSRRQVPYQRTFNYAKVFVDKTVSYLMAAFGIAVDQVGQGDEAEKRASNAEQAYFKVAIDNDLDALDFDTELDAAILGDGAYKVIWNGSRVRITAPDVQGIYVWSMPDDPSEIYQVVSQYRYPSGAWGTELWTNDVFELYTDSTLIERVPNPYGFIPFIIFPNLREPKHTWGRSDIPDIKETQRELNRALSQLGRILELSGNPIAVLEGVTESEDIAVEPGAVWTLPEESKAYLLDLLSNGGVKLHLDYIDMLYRVLHDTSESPKAAYGRTERDLSGVALEIEMQPLIQKVVRKQAIRSAVYRRRANMVLALLKQYDGQDFGEVSPRVAWGPILPQDRTRLIEDEARSIEKLMHSRQTAMEAIGVEDGAAEWDRILEERGQIIAQNPNAKGGKGSASESVSQAAPGDKE